MVKTNENFIKYYILLLPIICLVIYNCAIGQATCDHYKTTSGFQYVEFTSVKQGNQLPLIIAFHYFTSNPYEALQDYDSLKNLVRIIIPKGNFKANSGYSYFPPDYYNTDSLNQIKVSQRTLDSLAVFVSFIEKKYNRKAIVSRFSQGGDLSLLLAIYHPDLCKAVFPFAGHIHKQLFNKILELPKNSVPIYLYQGEGDPIVPISYSKNEIEILTNLYMH